MQDNTEAVPGSLKHHQLLTENAQSTENHEKAHHPAEYFTLRLDRLVDRFPLRALDRLLVQYCRQHHRRCKGGTVQPEESLNTTEQRTGPAAVVLQKIYNADARLLSTVTCSSSITGNMKKICFTENIYTYHIDFAGHVSNIVYIQWMEIGRLRLLEAAGMPAHEIMEESRILPSLVATSIQYKRQLFLGEKVHIELWLSQLKNVSAVMEFRFYNNGLELTARGQQKALFLNMADRRPHRLAPEERQRFEPFLETDKGPEER